MAGVSYKLKFLVVGNASTGKTSLVRWFIDGKFDERLMHTIGVDFGTKVLQVDGKAVKLELWDTAGQERFQCVARSYYRGAVGAVVVYSINDRKSFTDVQGWIKSVRDLAQTNVTIILVGNKVDLEEQDRHVSESEARRLAKDNNVHAFFETSAKTGTSVHDAFISMVRARLALGPVGYPIDPYLVGLNSAQFLNTHAPTPKSSNRCC